MIELGAALEVAPLVAVGALAGTVNTLAGGGSLLTLPALMLLGMPADVANGTNRVGVLMQAVAASWKLRAQGGAALRSDPVLALTCCAGAVLGASLSLQVDEPTLRRIIAALLLLVLPTLFVRAERWAGHEPAPRALVLGAMFAVGLYGGFIQAGVGLLLLPLLVLVAGRDAVSANALKTMLVGLFTLPALVVFVQAGKVAWGPGLALAAGSAFGGWLGGHLTLRGGPKLVRAALALALVASAFDLLFR